MAEVIFWLAVGVVAFVYFGYPAIITLLARLAPRPSRSDARSEPTVSMVVAAYNEEEVIEAKIENFLALDYPEAKLDLHIASDGSEDRTEEIVKRYQKNKRVKLHALRPRAGKATALERGVPQSKGDIVLLTDANTMLRPDAVRKLVRHFADPVVGAVTGDVKLVDAKSGYAESEGAYYKYERHLQECEAAVGSVVGVDGGMYAVRRAVFRAPPPDTILDDFVISMEIAKRGYRIVYDRDAIAEEDAAPDVAQEFRRKVRCLAGAWQCVKRGEGIPSPRTLGLFLMFLSHKFLRWIVPFFLIAAFVASGVLALTGGGAFYAAAFAAQVLFYALALAGWAGRVGKVAAIPYYFSMVNAAALLGFVRGVFGLQSVRWKKVGRTALKPATPAAAGLTESGQTGPLAGAGAAAN